MGSKAGFSRPLVGWLEALLAVVSLRNAAWRQAFEQNRFRLPEGASHLCASRLVLGHEITGEVIRFRGRPRCGRTGDADGTYILARCCT
jgi:hypothetical protein